MHALAPAFPVTNVTVAPKLYPRSEEYFMKQAEAWFGVRWEDISPVGPKREEGWKNTKMRPWHARAA
ncbi:hypothetical protein SERLA73DRAFT_140762 [Serpula lacrymans var. lacrymans S7.3]|uniref:Glutathione S-transferase UstS-like C-terminal domain-containing protein n=1 Tax=Serpula lacrymans var. lacrymans (strain S7.3) TaxID=936435 RepID=F8Q462_SERL3|nr:hypothetical protein SERLA73DRAFT_140762 [Serpula lacrymans var. lacrymans S7.3]